MRIFRAALSGAMLLMTVSCAVGPVPERGGPSSPPSPQHITTSSKGTAMTTTDPQSAQNILGRAGLSDPPHHGDLTSSTEGLQNFPDAALVTFTGERKAVLDWCRAAGLDVFPDAVVGPQDRVVLRGHGDGEGLALCSKDRDYGRGPNVRVAVDGAGATAVAVYSLPAGR
jgi:hypothetical protein